MPVFGTLEILGLLIFVLLVVGRLLVKLVAWFVPRCTRAIKGLL